MICRSSHCSLSLVVITKLFLLYKGNLWRHSMHQHWDLALKTVYCRYLQVYKTKLIFESIFSVEKGENDSPQKIIYSMIFQQDRIYDEFVSLKKRNFPHMCQQCQRTPWFTETVVHRCSVKKVFLEISQNSQENTCARVSFLIKL